MADKVKVKLDALRREADTAIERAEVAEAKLKEYETHLQNHDNEVKGLKNKIILLEEVKSLSFFLSFTFTFNFFDFNAKHEFTSILNYPI
jgi:hypothetical protein